MTSLHVALHQNDLCTDVSLGKLLLFQNRGWDAFRFPVMSSWLSGYFSLKILPISISMLSMHTVCPQRVALWCKYWSAQFPPAGSLWECLSLHCFYKGPCEGNVTCWFSRLPGNKHLFHLMLAYVNMWVSCTVPFRETSKRSHLWDSNLLI